MFRIQPFVVFSKLVSVEKPDLNPDCVTESDPFKNYMAAGALFFQRAAQLLTEQKLVDNGQGLIENLYP